MLINICVSLGTPSWSVVWGRWIGRELSTCTQVPWQTLGETLPSGLTGMLLRYTHPAACTALHSAVPCCAMLCCAVLCCAVLCCAVLCCAVLCCAVLCCAVLDSAVLHCAVLCCAVLCCAVLCFAALDRAVLCCGMLRCAVLCCSSSCTHLTLWEDFHQLVDERKLCCFCATPSVSVCVHGMPIAA